jgi:hypothetical protein|nr:MAG TPA: hypothetical protein [Herelleviridae sp.]
MGQGLSKNSPVQLELGKENYEALIERHGQWVRWRIASKCPCIKANTQQPDIHCKKCGGLGVLYGYQKQATVSQTVMVCNGSGIIELDGAFIDCLLTRCYDNTGNIYENAKKTGTFVMLNAEKLPSKGVYVTAIMTAAVLKTVEHTQAESIGNGYYRVAGLRSSRTKTEGLYHTAPGDIESIGTISDTEGNTYEVGEIRQDYIFVKNLPEVPPKTLLIEQVQYIPPFTFVILNQNLSKSDAQVMQDNNGDAVLTFPYTFDVSADDVITVLSGTYTQKSIVPKKDAEYDVIPAYFVDEIVQCAGAEREYTQGVDFILCGTNYLKWLCDDRPEDGEGYAITYKVYPTYKVVKTIPQIRTSENQRMPKKAVIKLYDTYGEARGLNRK